MSTFNSLTILQDLIRFKTDSVYDKHLDCLQYVENMLINGGWTVQRVSTQYQDHLVAVNQGKLQDISDGILLSGHLDVVPAAPEQFEPRIENGCLYGRGTVDMKFFAASVLAQLPFLKNRPFPVVLVFTFDEELLGHGIEAVQKFLREKNIKPAACLLGEPTDFNACVGTRGCIELKTIVTGHAAHSSMPELGVNALYIAAKAIGFLENLNGKLVEQKSNLNVGVLHGGEKQNIVAPSAEMVWSLRALNQEIVDSVLQQFDDYCRRLEQEYVGAKIETVQCNALPPFYETHEFPLLELVQQILGTAKVSFPYATEAGYYQQLDIPTVICGVSDSHLAHTDNEHILLTDLEKYDTFLYELLNVECIA